MVSRTSSLSMVACLTSTAAMESRSTDARTMRAPATKRSSKRSLFSGSNDGLHAPGRVLEDENERANEETSDLENISERSDSESDFEPSDASDSESSGSEVGLRGSPRVSRKRKRGTKQFESERGSHCVCSLCRGTEALSVQAAASDAFVCDIEGCDRRFADEALAIQHVHVWHDVRDKERYVCSTCDTFHLTLHDLYLHHRQSCHAVGDPPQRLFVCDADASCRQAYKKKDKLTQHLRRFHQPSEDGSVFECSRCDATFTTRFERARHLDSEHPGHSGAPATPCFTCEFVGCDKSYSKREHLTRHVLATHEAPQEKPFGCDLCGVRFVYKHALARHHTNCHTTDVEKPYACPVCLLAFKKKSLLQAHSFVHTGVLPFECEDCDERFLKRFQLARHARKHANAKPSQAQVFMCEHDDCSELLFSIEEKTEHMREAHGLEVKEEPAECKRRGKKPRSGGAARELRCLVCDQVFARIQNLRSHLRTHFEAIDARKLHACPMDGCDKAYTKKSNLMAHYNAVHDPVKSKRFKCPYDGCAGAFGYKKVLLTHIASIHERATVIKKEEVYSGSDSDDEAHGDMDKQSRAKHGKKRRRGRETMGVLARVLGADEAVIKASP